MDLTIYLSFIGVSLLLIIAPGPDNIFVMAQSISYGKKEGIATAFGLCSGVTIHTLAASIGLSAILYQSNIAFSILKYLGAFYLLYLAYQAFRSSNEVGEFAKPKKQTLPALYRRGFLMNVLNPKVSLFFLAFLPQFIEKNGISVRLQMIVLGLTFMILTLIVFSIIAIFAGSLGEKLLQNEKSSRIINLSQGAIFTGIGLKLFFMDK
ncbi:LysE family translocator [Gottfriedia solisilvae]|uniref:LysE family translocator n=1 Tax=Gottfriedia solisilvae TaxID=1516104 RepID=A0A8J3ARA7_9BACI|nr:LysE family translocator [Gottfriedia solisilvae]GGI15176.1 LysE family translocator [Gottfriedia solisilvae]